MNQTVTSPPKSLASIKRSRTHRLAKLTTKIIYLYNRGSDEQIYTVICNEFVSLGGVYVKFLQGVLLQSPMLKKWQDKDRLKIFEDLDSESLEIITYLQAHLTPDKLSMIKSVQPEPFAAGSFGQVYFGYHVDGTAIIIKVLRPMVKETLRYDLRILKLFSKRLTSKLYPNMNIDMTKAAADFRSSTLNETDYIAEAKFANEMHEHYREHPKLFIPKTYTQLCTDSIIVQEYVNGVSVAQIVKLKDKGTDIVEFVKSTLGSDLDQQLNTLAYELLVGMFTLPKVMGDPHPGNIRLMQDNRIAIIDFGISADSPSDKAGYYGVLCEYAKIYSGQLDISALFRQFMRYFVTDLYVALKRLSNYGAKTTSSPSVDPSKPQPDLTHVLGKYAEDNFKNELKVDEDGLKTLIETGGIMSTLNNAINSNNRYGLVLKLKDSQTLRATQTLLTMIESLGRRTIVMPKVYQDVVSYIELNMPELDCEPAPASTQTAVDTISNWLERLADSDPMLFKAIINKVKNPQISTLITE